MAKKFSFTPADKAYITQLFPNREIDWYETSAVIKIPGEYGEDQISVFAQPYGKIEFMKQITGAGPTAVAAWDKFRAGMARITNA